MRKPGAEATRPRWEASRDFTGQSQKKCVAEALGEDALPVAVFVKGDANRGGQRV